MICKFLQWTIKQFLDYILSHIMLSFVFAAFRRSRWLRSDGMGRVGRLQQDLWLRHAHARSPNRPSICALWNAVPDAGGTRILREHAQLRLETLPVRRWIQARRSSDLQGVPINLRWWALQRAFWEPWHTEADEHARTGCFRRRRCREYRKQTKHWAPKCQH